MLPKSSIARPENPTPDVAPQLIRCLHRLLPAHSFNTDSLVVACITEMPKSHVVKVDSRKYLFNTLRSDIVTGEKDKDEKTRGRGGSWSWKMIEADGVKERRC